jgi:selenocysteine lyase/cysteine desulfurase
VHFNCGSVGATPRLVVDAMANFTRELEADPYNNEWGGLGAGQEAVREKAAEFIGASLDEVALTRNTKVYRDLVACLVFCLKHLLPLKVEESNATR